MLITEGSELGKCAALKIGDVLVMALDSIGDVLVMAALDSQSRGCGFESQPYCHHVTTLALDLVD